MSSANPADTSLKPRALGHFSRRAALSEVDGNYARAMRSRLPGGLFSL